MTLGRRLLAVALALAPTMAVAGAQSAPREPLKRAPLTSPVRAACEPRAAPAAPTAAQRARARELAQRGQQAAILGDRTSAREQLRQAALLDPTDRDLAYQLARAHEAAGAPDDAAREYCRFLALAPGAPEANEARERVAALARPAGGAEPAANAPLRAGLAAYDAGRLADAEVAFARAVAAEPRWADAYYDRGVVREARGDRDGARTDFEQYLRLKPEADDRTAVVARVNTLGKLPPSPGQALALGLVIPGAGQFYTGRPVAGLFALGGAAGALAYGVQTQVRSVQVTHPYTDPFGNSAPYTTTEQQEVRPHAAVGVAAVAAILVGGAFEAYGYAKHRPAPNARVSVVPAGDGVGVRIAILR